MAWVTLNRPEALNAFDPTMQRELRELWQPLRTNDDVRCIVLTGAGDKAFCTGLDREGDRVAIEDQPPGKLPGYNTPWDFDDPGKSVCPKTNDLWKPVIAAVNGMACGGAFYILGEVDFIIAVGPGHLLRPARHLRHARRLRADLPAAQDALPGGHAPVAAGGPRADVGRAGPRDRVRVRGGAGRRARGAGPLGGPGHRRPARAGHRGHAAGPVDGPRAVPPPGAGPRLPVHPRGHRPGHAGRGPGRVQPPASGSTGACAEAAVRHRQSGGSAPTAASGPGCPLALHSS